MTQSILNARHGDQVTARPTPSSSGSPISSSSPSSASSSSCVDFGIDVARGIGARTMLTRTKKEDFKAIRGQSRRHRCCGDCVHTRWVLLSSQVVQ